MNPHSQLCREIEVELSRMPDVYVTGNASGVAYYQGARVGYGAFSPGAPDLLAVVGPHGRLVAIECKTGAARQTVVQRKCQQRLERVGVKYVVARTVNDAVEAVRG